MSTLIMLIKFWKEVLILILSLLTVLFASLSVVYITKYKNADLHCEKRINEIHSEYRSKREDAEKKAYEAGQTFEEKKSELKEKQIVTHKEIEKIIDRPIYINVCLDTDGLSEINSSIEAYDPI